MIDCIIVGAGPDGLATGAALSERSADHLILEFGTDAAAVAAAIRAHLDGSG
jgi:2-polyprenyl-6-methoxyphenol hydroxylase-like FAD-dependent oxidoreductase